MPTDPTKNMRATEDFLRLLTHTHVVAAAKLLQTTQEPEACGDDVHMYAVEVLTLSLLWHGFHDAITEGDGDRILRYWRILLVVFKSTNHPNYTKEAVHLLLQYHYMLSDHQKAQLLWSRCINTQGRQGTNIPCDLHMEHLNRTLKTLLRGLGDNMTPKTVVKAGKSLAVVQQVCHTIAE